MELSTVRKVMRICVGVMLAFSILGLLFKDTVFAVICAFIAMIAVIGHLVIAIAFWRCPYCDRHLPTRGALGICYCPHCGNNIEY